MSSATTDLIDKRIGDYLIIEGNQKFRILILTKGIADEDLRLVDRADIPVP